MTKHFCDLCGKPAVEFWPSLRVNFPDKTWRGNKTEPGSISVVDGEWTPHIDARIVFDACEFPRSTRTHTPDLCAGCIADLLMKMAGSVRITEPDRATPKQAKEGFDKMREAVK